MIIGLAFSTVTSSCSSDSDAFKSTKVERNAIKDGNKAYNDKEFAKAIEYYQKAIKSNPNSEKAKLNKAVATLLNPESDSTAMNEANQLLAGFAQSAMDPEVSDNALYNMSNFMVYMGDALAAQQQMQQPDQAQGSPNHVQLYKQAISGYEELLRRKPGDFKVTQNLRITQLKLPEDQQQQQQNQDQQDQQQNQEQQNQDQQDKQQQQQQQPEAAQLRALENHEAETRKNTRFVEPRTQNDKPW